MMIMRSDELVQTNFPVPGSQYYLDVRAALRGFVMDRQSQRPKGRTIAPFEWIECESREPVCKTGVAVVLALMFITAVVGYAWEITRILIKDYSGVGTLGFAAMPTVFVFILHLERIAKGLVLIFGSLLFVTKALAEFLTRYDRYEAHFDLVAAAPAKPSRRHARRDAATRKANGVKTKTKPAKRRPRKISADRAAGARAALAT